MTVLRWEDPPETKAGQHRRVDHPRRSDKWTATAEELRSRPGRWAVIAEGDRPEETLVTQIRHARFPEWAPAGSFDATAHKRGDQHTVYARYLGEQER